MSGKVSGAVSFESGGERYSMAFTTNSLCALEEQFGGQSIAAVGADIASGRAGARGVRALFRAALVSRHPDITEGDAGRLMTEMGADLAAEKLQAAFEGLQLGLGDGDLDLPSADPKGALAFEVAGQRLVFVFGFNAQAELEQYFEGLSPEEIMRKFNRREVSLRDLRAMVRAGLFDHREVSLEAAGEVIDLVGMRLAGRAVATAFVAAFPEAADEIEEEPSGNRRQRRAAKANPTPSRRKAGTGKS